MRNAGTYALIIKAQENLSIKIGRLGTFEIPAGYYVYAGSALRGLQSRLDRHLRQEKKLHWHIDYLLQHSNIIQIWYSLSKDRMECAWNGIIAKLPGATPFITGFGSSDCRCRTHLTRFLSAPSFAAFKEELTKRGLPPPQLKKI